MTNRRFKDPNRPATLFHFMTNLEVALQDEELMRLLVYKPQGYDEKLKQLTPDPLDSSLPDLLDGSKKSWDLLRDRIRKGDKRTDIDDDSKCILYLQEGRERPVFGNAFFVKQEVIIGVLVHEDFEDDWRMSRIRDRIYEILIHTVGVAGFGKLESNGGDPYDAPEGFRRMDYRFLFSNNKKTLN